MKSYVSHWPAQRWQEYEPLLSYCRDNAVKLIACGTPLKVVLLYCILGVKMIALLSICIFSCQSDEN